MNIVKVTKKNLEFITEQLLSKNDIELRKGTDTYILYDDTNRIKIEENKKKKTQRCEIDSTSPSISTAQILPFIKKSKYLELPKEDNLEDIMRSMNYEKIDEVQGFDRYKNTTKLKFEVMETFRFFKNFNLKEQLKDYFSLWKDEPEFKSYEILRIISNASQGALMGSVMPSFWDYGGTMKMAGTLAATQKIIMPISHIVTSGSMGKVVDKASVNSDIKGLKNLQKKVGGMYAFLATDTYLMQQNIIDLCPSPETALLVLFGLQTVGMSAGKMNIEGKSFYAVRDYLIRKNPELENNEYKDKFYQLTGTGQALAQLSYAAMFTSSWLACKSNPLLIFPVATISAISLVASKFMWGYNRKLKNPVAIKAKDYVQKGNSYVFDTGWEITPREDTYLEKKIGGYQIPLRKGITIRSEYDITAKDGKCLEFITEKSRIKIKTNTKEKYKIDKINEKEYVVSPLSNDSQK